MAKSIQELTAIMAEFPGIGPRQARRIVQFLLAKDGAYRSRQSELVKDIRNQVSQCSVCFRYDDMNGGTTCNICSDSKRNPSLLMVVEKDVCIEGVETSGAYKGRYFVLGGLLPLTERKNRAPIRSKELSMRIQNLSGQENPPEGGITEIIFALSTTPEGDFTARELISALRLDYPQLTLSMLGRGLSVGAEIEYADSETIRNALQNRM